MYFQVISFKKNPVVISTVCVLAGLLLVMVFVAYYWDKHDLKRVKYIPLCGKNAGYKYEVTVITGRQIGAGE